MAFFAKDGQFLVTSPNNPNTLIFGPEVMGSSRAIVAFHEVTGTTFSTTPSLNVCSTKRYILRLVVPNVITTPMFLVAQGTSTTMFGVAMQATLADLVIFSPLPTDALINTFHNFPATIMAGGQTASGQFIIEPTANFAVVGYTEMFPAHLNDCTACGCPENMTCKASSGQCTVELLGQCPQNAVCGELNGQCFGTCYGGFVCESVSGKFHCVTTEFQTVYFRVIVILVIALFVALAAYYLFRSWHDAATGLEEQPEDYIYLPPHEHYFPGDYRPSAPPASPIEPSVRIGNTLYD